MAEPWYITTPIYYVNDVPHVGHAYTTIAADVLARHQRRLGREVFFLTGTDEHGAKIAEAAQAHRKAPKEYCDEIVAHFKTAWRELDISYDRFIRTTDTDHEEAVQVFLSNLYQAGHIYRGRYEGRYCVGCEKFVTDEDLVDGMCILHAKAPIWYAEDNYFFRLSQFQEPLIAAITDERDPNHFVIEPESRANEVLGKLRLGLADISISRASLAWGVPIPFDPTQTTYVWVDALLNYLSGIGFQDDQARFQRFWPADLHLMAKDILWFHAVIWPAVLMAAGLRSPRRIFAHGFFTINGRKISKTLGNILHPRDLIARFGADATRYLMLSEFPFGTDGDISEAAMEERYHADLSNDLGNLLNRTVAMINRYFDSELPFPETTASLSPSDNDLRAVAEAALSRFEEALDRLTFEDALAAIWQLVSRANKYVEENAPWSLARTDRARLVIVLNHLAEALRIIAHLVWPVMPNIAQKMVEQLGVPRELERSWAEAGRWGIFPSGRSSTGASVPLFPRVGTRIEA
ncbi:MAG: methionine--tRNA ligase [Chloroflexi bacterium]|nr:methionine--tRNA ligase [Chloroflexota bacterium]